MDEKWLDVSGYEGAYEVSNLGRVRSVARVITRTNGRKHTIKSKIRVPRPNPKGHLGVTLVHMARLRTFSVHRLVLTAFVGEPRHDQIARHLNGNPADNRLENLAWGTASENQVDAVAHGSHYLASKASCKRGHPLQPPNLAKGNRRICLACKREHDASHHEGRPFNKAKSDARYKDILAGIVRHKSESRF